MTGVERRRVGFRQAKDWQGGVAADDRGFYKQRGWVLGLFWRERRRCGMALRYGVIDVLLLHFGLFSICSLNIEINS